MITLSFCSIAFREEPIETVIPKLGEIGYDAVEIFAGQLEGKSDAELKEVRQLAQDSCLRIEVVSPYLWLTQDAELLNRSREIALKTIHQARVLGAPKIRTFTDSGPSGIGSRKATPEHWETAVSALQEFTREAPELLFVVETHELTLADTPESTLQLLDRVGNDNLTVLYQPNSPETTLPYYEQLRPHIRHIHLHNLDEDGKGTWVDTGLIDIPVFLKCLVSDGYAHSLSVEYCWRGVTWERAEAAHAFLSPLLS